MRNALNSFTTDKKGKGGKVATKDPAYQVGEETASDGDDDDFEDTRHKSKKKKSKESSSRKRKRDDLEDESEVVTLIVFAFFYCVCFFSLVCLYISARWCLFL